MTAPEPLTPPDCDLTDFAFMPLDVARLRDSELASNETPEACWAAVLLWSAAWHQIPAASMPNDDKWIAKQAGYALRGKIDKAWADVKPGAMRGWVLCSDGRLYHAVVAEKAREAWKSKTEQRYRTEVARVKKHNQRHGTSHTTPEFSEWVSLGRPQGHHLAVPGDTSQKGEDNNGDTPSKGQREGQGQGQGQGDYSVTNVTGGASPPPDDDAPPDAPPTRPVLTPDEIIFGYGLPLLTNAGTPEKQARSFLGGLRKRPGGDEAVVNALRDCLKAKPLQPLEWLAAALPPPDSAGTSAKPNKQEALEKRNRAVADEWAGLPESKKGEVHEAV